MATLEELEQQVIVLQAQLDAANTRITDLEEDLMGAFTNLTAGVISVSENLSSLVELLNTNVAVQVQATRDASDAQSEAFGGLTSALDRCFIHNQINLTQATIGVGNIDDYWKSMGWAELNKVKSFDASISKTEEKLNTSLVDAKASIDEKFRSA